MDADTRAMLSKAKGLVAQGWLQGNSIAFHGGRFHYCIIGALTAVEYGSGQHRPYSAWAARRALAEAIGNPHIVSWNDAPGRTQADVVALFDRALADDPVPADVPMLVAA